MPGAAAAFSKALSADKPGVQKAPMAELDEYGGSRWPMQALLGSWLRSIIEKLATFLLQLDRTCNREGC